MTHDLYQKAPEFRSRLSFGPLLRKWKEMIQQAEGQQKDELQRLIDGFSKVPRLAKPIDDYQLLQQHDKLLQETITTLFPLSLSYDQANAITPPFSNKVIYASAAFRKQFMSDEHTLMPFDPQVAANINEARVSLAYKMILHQFYGIDLGGGDAFICAAPDPLQNIYNYFELSWNWQLITISHNGNLPDLPEDFSVGCHEVDDLRGFPQLIRLLPLNEFVFEGLLLLSIKQVTEREAADRIRQLLLKDEALEETEAFQAIQQEIGYLLQLTSFEAGVTSFDGFGTHHLIPQPASLLYRYLEKDSCRDTVASLKNQFDNRPFLIVPQALPEHSLLPVLSKKSNWQYLLFAALYEKGKVVGCLEIAFNEPVKNLHGLIIRLRSILPDLQQALESKKQRLAARINRIVKEHFTALQPSVEWKFNNAAIHYLLQEGADAKMEPVIFDNVFPLYAAFDIRHSSTERNKAVQQDLLLQLQIVKSIFSKAEKYYPFPLLEELSSEVSDYSEKIEDFLLSGDEEAVHHLLKTEVVALLQNLSETIPELREEISSYFAIPDQEEGILNRHLQQYEKAVMGINDYLSRLVDTEQEGAQDIYPHYFERFATDGVEFNMFIGQSITPGKKFNALYLDNLRLWQLKVLAQGAARLHQMKEKTILPLETTQLVLVYNQPISIRFRTAERKFDVDGIHHSRYEVVKKRIDKAYIKNTNERLTRPGSIAIVYFNENDIQEYYRYIGFLKKQGWLDGAVEKLELDEMQGVNGLKALRVPINMGAEQSSSLPQSIRAGST